MKKNISKILCCSLLAILLFSCKTNIDPNTSNNTDTNEIPPSIYKITESPKVVESMEIDGKQYEIIEYGDYPQTRLVDESVIKDKTHTVNINGWDCYTDGNDNYYVKTKATPYTGNNHNNSQYQDDIYKFDDGEEIAIGRDYYFKLEPIQWIVISDNYKKPGSTESQGKLLLSTKVLTNLSYMNQEDTYDASYRTIKNEENVMLANYEHSKIRAYLNGLSYMDYDKNNEVTHCVENNDYLKNGFLQKAFHQKQ